jgi:hypothetical protein
MQAENMMFVFPLPDWLHDMPEGRAKERAKGRFFLKLAILYASPDGHTRHLAKMIGINYGALKTQIIRQPTWETREAIGRVLGPNFTPPKPPDMRCRENQI